MNKLLDSSFGGLHKPADQFWKDSSEVLVCECGKSFSDNLSKKPPIRGREEHRKHWQHDTMKDRMISGGFSQR